MPFFSCMRKTFFRTRWYPEKFLCSTKQLPLQLTLWERVTAWVAEWMLNQDAVWKKGRKCNSYYEKGKPWFVQVSEEVRMMKAELPQIGKEGEMGFFRHTSFSGFITSSLWQTNNFSDLRLSLSNLGLLQITIKAFLHIYKSIINSGCSTGCKGTSALWAHQRIWNPLEDIVHLVLNFLSVAFPATLNTSPIKSHTSAFSLLYLGSFYCSVSFLSLCFFFFFVLLKEGFRYSIKLSDEPDINPGWRGVMQIWAKLPWFHRERFGRIQGRESTFSTLSFEPVTKILEKRIVGKKVSQVQKAAGLWNAWCSRGNKSERKQEDECSNCFLASPSSGDSPVLDYKENNLSFLTHD